MKACKHSTNYPCRIDAYEYDAAARTLRFLYIDGTEKTYREVPIEVYEAFDADPGGRFYAKHIQQVYGVA